MRSARCALLLRRLGRLCCSPARSWLVGGRGHASAALPLAPLSSLGKLKPRRRQAPSPRTCRSRTAPCSPRRRPSSSTETIDGITCEAEKVAFHIHAHLTIFVDGKARRSPTGSGSAGSSAGCRPRRGVVRRDRHVLHVAPHPRRRRDHPHRGPEADRPSPSASSSPSGGRTLSTTQVGPAKGKVTTFYDGKVWTGNPASIPLTSEVQIQLDVGTPLIAPEQIVFPKGLAASMAKPS